MTLPDGFSPLGLNPSGVEMVPDPSLSRRRLLGGLAGVAGGATLAVGATKPTALPDVLTDWATEVYPTPPEVRELWRPTVTEAHAREAVTLLDETVAEGKRLRKRIETDEQFTGAGGWLDNAREALGKGNYHEALFDAGYGLQFAGEELGFARAKLGETDRESLADRSRRLRDRSGRVADDLKPYPTVAPGRDLAWYYAIERQLVMARFHDEYDALAEEGDDADDGSGPESREYDAEEVGAITASLLQARLHVRTAERYRDLLGAKLDGSAARYADHLRSVADEFRAGIDSFPSREERRSEFRAEFAASGDDGTSQPYEFARSRLLRWCYDYDYRFGLDEASDLPVYRAVEFSTGLAQRRAHDFALDRLVVEPGDRTFDSGHTLAAKRRARSTYRSVVGSDPPPLLTRQVPRAVEDLQVAVVGFGGGGQRPHWREQLKAYCYALVGRAKLREYPALFDALVDA